MTVARVLFIDESLSKRLATWLNQRGRAADSASAREMTGLKDEPLLRALFGGGEDLVLITADDDLPGEHAGVVREVRATVATVAPFQSGRWASEEAYKREVVSRWAHTMQEQERGTSRRYSLSGGRKWTPKKRLYT